jgi:anti-anti-sigma regulatory factor
MGTASRGVSRFVLALAVVSFVGSVAATLLFGGAASAASQPVAPIAAQASR